MNELSKKISTGLAITLLTLSFATPSFAAEKKENDKVSHLLYKKSEEKDLKKLFKMAKNHETEVDLSSFKKNPGDVSTAQLLSVRDENGQIYQDLAVTTFTTDPTISEQLTNVEITPLSTGTISDSENDPTVSYTSYSTAYYTKTVSGTTSYYLLDRATGGWTRLDSSVTIASKLVRLGCSNFGKTQSKEYTSFSGNTFDIPAPSTWVKVSNAGGGVLGVTMETTYDRHGSRWTHVFKNNLSF